MIFSNFSIFLIICVYCLLKLKIVTSFEKSVNDNCFTVENYFWKHLGSKTPYRYVANYNDSEIAFEGCTAAKIWAVVRHGTRYPGRKFIKKMKVKLLQVQKSIMNNVNQSRVSLCSQSINNIMEWQTEIEEDWSKKLGHEGEDEMVELGERFQNRFPSLLKTHYSNSTFKFRSTATERTKQSKYYFLVGLFGRKVANHVWSPEPVYKDPILRFYKLCGKWLKEVHENPQANIQSEKYKDLPSTKKIVATVSERLGFEESLDFELIHMIYTMCAYESALNKVPSRWCSVFTEDEMAIMEFVQELKHYWTDGYGFDINFKQACPLLKDMLNHMGSEEEPTSSFYFTHSGTILKLLSHLGLYYDEKKLTHDRFAEPRLWKASYMDAFGSNLAFVSFKCGSQLKLLAMHQERFITLPGCPKEGLCSFDKIMKTYKKSYNNCDFEEMCKL